MLRELTCVKQVLDENRYRNGNTHPRWAVLAKVGLPVSSRYLTKIGRYGIDSELGGVFSYVFTLSVAAYVLRCC